MIGPFDSATVLIGGAAAIAVVVLALVAVRALKENEAAQADDGPTADLPDGATVDNGADRVTLEAPDTSGSLLGAFRMWRHQQKQQKMAKRGYVKWYKVDAQMSRPKWVKPELDQSGEWKYHDKQDDVWYYFPEDGMVHDSLSGAYVAVHKRGEATPINLRDPAMPSVPADRLKEAIQLEAESDPPGMFDKLDLSPEMIMASGIAIMLILGGLTQVM